MNTEDDEFARIEREAARGAPDAIHHTDPSETLEYITGWNDCRAAMLAEQPAPVQSVLDEMWEALKGYQPQADAAGHGETWARMCSEKTVDAAHAAAAAAAAADAVALADALALADAVAHAAAAVALADADADYAAAVQKWAQRAIERINKLKEES